MLTAPITAWAHHLREFGNNAAHDGEGTFEDAEQLVRFVQFFLRATFELSAEIEEARQAGIVRAQ